MALPRFSLRRVRLIVLTEGAWVEVGWAGDLNQSDRIA